jgi:hypothetical protein
MANTGLFSRLKRLFSTDVIIRNVGGNEISTIDTSTIQTTGEFETNSLVDRFGRLYSGNPTSLYGQQFNQNYQYLRTQLYSEYDVMDQDAIIASALDIIADESTLKNDMGEVLQIRSSNEDIQKILYNLFYDVLNIEFNLWSWIRQMCKYGDFFLKLDIAEKFGVYNVTPYTAFSIARKENFDPENPAKVIYEYNPDGFTGGDSGYYTSPSQKPSPNVITFDNYEMAHFRLVADTNYLPYGRAYIEPARKLYKQYALMEDAMLVHRIVRAPEKRSFFINVGSIPPNEIDAFMQKTISNLKRTPYVDPQTGQYNLKYNMQNMLEDFYIPVRGNDAATRIETTKGLDYDGIADVEYLRDKLFAALKIPKAFLGYEADLEGKATLAAEDIRFARTIDRLQRIILSELNKIALVHLYSQGYTNESLTNFELSMTTPSIIYDQERIELLKSKAELAQTLLDQKLLPTDWIYDNVFHFSEDQYDEYRDLIREDAKRNFRLDQIQEEGNDPLQTGKSYGTPHDLAYLYGKGRSYTNDDHVPPGYDEDEKSVMGRPKDSITNRNKQDSNFGRDRLGAKGNKEKGSSDIKPNFKGGPLTLETPEMTLLKNKTILENLDKKVLSVTKEDEKSSLLDESQLKE